VLTPAPMRWPPSACPCVVVGPLVRVARARARRDAVRWPRPGRELWREPGEPGANVGGRGAGCTTLDGRGSRRKHRWLSRTPPGRPLTLASSSGHHVAGESHGVRRVATATRREADFRPQRRDELTSREPDPAARLDPLDDRGVWLTAASQHGLGRPNRPPVPAGSSWTSLVIRITPVARSGCPERDCPRFGLARSSDAPVSSDQASRTGAERLVDLEHVDVPTSSRPRPSGCEFASIGPVSISTGSEPPRPAVCTRASGIRSYRRVRASDEHAARPRPVWEATRGGNLPVRRSGASPAIFSSDVSRRGPRPGRSRPAASICESNRPSSMRGPRAGGSGRTPQAGSLEAPLLADQLGRRGTGDLLVPVALPPPGPNGAGMPADGPG